MASPTLIPLELPPGILKVDSPNAGNGRYVDCNKVRFIKGKPEKWRGWNLLIDDALNGKSRGAESWVNNAGSTNAAFGTHLKLYVITGNDTLLDITPIRETDTLGTDPFSMTSGSAVVRVTDTAHGADDGDFVTYTGATAAGGITIAGEYQITKIDADTYDITHSAAATSTTTGGGASVEAVYQINVGTADSVVGTGYGAGTYGSGTYGTPRDSGIEIELRVWSLQNYGTDLMASPSGGGIYLWEEGASDTGVVVSGAPTYVRAMFITGERFVMALGTGALTPMTVKWPDQDDPTDWTPSAANTANERTLQSGSKLMGGTELGDGVNLVWTDTSVYLFQYTGGDFIYDSRLAGTNCGLAAKRAFCRVGGNAFWMSGHHFHMYSGGVAFIPNQEDIRGWVFDRMDRDLITKSWCIYDERNNQVRFHYCAVGETEPNSYVDVSLDDFNWTVGTLARTTGTRFRTSDASSLLVDHDGYVFSHDEGQDADGEAMESFIQYGLYALTRGEQNVDIFGIIPDCARQVGDLEFEIFTKERPNSSTSFDTQTVVIGDTDIIGDCRVSGRHFGMKVTSNVVGGDFRMGNPILETAGAGQRR